MVGVHLEAPLSEEAAARRDRTALALAAWVRAQKDPVVVLGDFNASPWSRTFTQFRTVSGLVDSEAGFGIARTWPAHQPRWLTWLVRIPIDHCFFDARMTALARGAGDGGRSNHLPLLIRLTLPRP